MNKSTTNQKFVIVGEQTQETIHQKGTPQQSIFTTQPITESSDIAETTKYLNEDVMDEDKFSSIDMKTRLLPVEISSIVSLDTLVSLRFLPTEASFISRSKKRLNVSLRGQGRTEIVSIAQGIEQQKQGQTFFQKMGLQK